MTVYVDNMRAPVGRMFLSHMIADTDSELHAMAARIGVSRRWHQKPPKVGSSHYDIAQSSRAKALEAGAVLVTMKTCAAMCARRRMTGELGDPASAIDWYRENWRAARELPVADAEVRCRYCGLPHPRAVSVESVWTLAKTIQRDQVCPACAWRLKEIP